MLDAGSGDLVIEGSMLPDVAELRLNAGMQIEVLDGAVPVGVFDPNLITSRRIVVNLYDGSDTLRLPLINQVAPHFEISANMGVEIGDIVELLANVGPGGGFPALELTSNSIHLGGPGGSLYSTNGLVLDGNVTLDGSVTITTNGALFDAADAPISSSNPATDLTISTGGGEARIGRLDDTGGSLVNEFAVENVGMLVFLDVPGDVSVGALHVGASNIAVHNNINVANGDATLSSEGIMTFDSETEPAITIAIDTHGQDLTLISGVTGAAPFAIAGSTSFTMTGGTVVVSPQVNTTPISLVSSATIPDPNSFVIDIRHSDLFTGFDSFEIGGPQQSGTISVLEPLNIGAGLHLHAGMEDINVAAPITADGSLTATSNGGTTKIDALIAAASITLNDAVRIDRDVVLRATAGGLTFNGAVVSQASETNDLTIRSDGDVAFQGPVGDMVGGALGDILIITAGNIVVTSTVEADSLVQARPGDYNHDGGVDAADYVVWRKGVGTSVAPPFVGADGDGDSSIDPGDYDVWTEHFGETLPGSGSAAGTTGYASATAELGSVRAAQAVVTSDDDWGAVDGVLGALAEPAAPDVRTFWRSRFEAAQHPAALDHALIAWLDSRTLEHSLQTVPVDGGFFRRHSWDDSLEAISHDIDAEIDEPLAIALAEWQ
jgi:hypothetical protein